MLLVHGFTGTPFELRFVGGRLARAGFHSVGVRLPGHGLDPYALERTGAQDWLNEARAALLRFDRPAHLVGLSMGGLLVSLLAAEHPDRVASLVLCAPALRLARRRAVMMGLSRLSVFSPRLRFFTKRPSELTDPLMRRRIPCIGRTPSLAAAEFRKVQGWARQALPRVSAPAMIIYSEKDHTVAPSAALECAERIGSRPVRMVRLERSAHILTLDVERDRVVAEIERFIRAL